MDNKEKKILLLSFSDIEKDGRLKELYKVFEKIGIVKIYDKKSTGILKFLYKLLFLIEKPDYLVIDNRAVIPFAFLFTFLKKPKFIIQDCREMYFFKDQHTLKSKLGCIFESAMIKRADAIIVANSYRAKIVKNYYNLKYFPIVFENIRKLSDAKKYLDFEKKYNYLKNNKFKIVATGGFQNTPSENKLINTILDLDMVEIYFVGNNKKMTFSNEKKGKIHFIDKVNLEELKYLLKNMDIGYVGYEIVNLNTKYCASGKIYEYAYEELPVLAYKNKPLKHFIDEYKIGVSGENFKDLILELKDNYYLYKKNTLELKNKIEKLEKNNILKVVNEIEKLLKEREIIL